MISGSPSSRLSIQPLLTKPSFSHNACIGAFNSLVEVNSFCAGMIFSKCWIGRCCNPFATLIRMNYQQFNEILPEEILREHGKAEHIPAFANNIAFMLRDRFGQIFTRGLRPMLRRQCDHIREVVVGGTLNHIIAIPLREEMIEKLLHERMTLVGDRFA